MTRHSKVFVPVSAVDAAKLDAGKLLKVYKEHEQGDYSLYGFAEEKENVYVLTEDELKVLFLEFSKKTDNYYGFVTMPDGIFVTMPDRIYEPRIDQFLQLKTNPQTNE